MSSVTHQCNSPPPNLPTYLAAMVSGCLGSVSSSFLTDAIPAAERVRRWLNSTHILGQGPWEGEGSEGGDQGERSERGGQGEE